MIKSFRDCFKKVKLNESENAKFAKENVEMKKEIEN